MTPTISVIMPAYNCAPFIEKAIRSILDQTFTDFELIICDDCSTDETWSKIESFDDQRIRKYKNQHNLGLLKNFNHLLAMVNGSYITSQDADDWSEPTRLAEQMVQFVNHPDVDLVGCSGGFYYDDSKLIKCTPFQSGYVSIANEIQPFMLPAILYKRDVLQQVSGYHPYFEKATSMDQYFIFNILSKFKGYAFDSFLYTARFNISSSTRNLDNFRKATAHEAFLLLRQQRLATGSDWLIEAREPELLEFERSLFRDKKFMAEKYREFAVYQIDSKHFATAAPLLWKSLLASPTWPQTYRTILYGFRKFFMG